MKPLFSLFAVLIAGPVAAHPGHLTEVAGHGHWIGLAALGAAIAIAVLAGRKSRGDDRAKDTDETDGEDETQEA